MANQTIIGKYTAWISSTSRANETIRLRIRHIEQLATKYGDLFKIQTTDLENYLLEQRRYAAETRKSKQASWTLFYTWAVARGHTDHNPALPLEPVRVPHRIPKIAPDHAITKALTNATPRDTALILLARYACLRLTELTTLHTKNRENDLLRIIGKGNKERIIAINDELAKALDKLEQIQGHGYYFPGRTRAHLHPQSVHKIIYRITGHNPHSLRHAGATTAYNVTRNLRAVQEMLGHASLATTQRYLHLDMAARREIAAATIIRRAA